MKNKKVLDPGNLNIRNKQNVFLVYGALQRSVKKLEDTIVFTYRFEEDGKWCYTTFVCFNMSIFFF